MGAAARPGPLIGRIAEALSESDLPYKVDIVDLAIAAPGFRAHVLADCIAFDIGLREAGDHATLGADACSKPGG